MPDTLRGVLAEEQMWREDVGVIRATLAEQAAAVANRLGNVVVRSEIDIAADRIPRSWQCTQFSGEPCAFAPICNHAPGWEQPLTMNIYDIRTPHHATERAACEAGGVVFPVDDTELEEVEL